MKKFYLLALLSLSFLGNAQFTKIMDLSGDVKPGMYDIINNYNIWNNKLFTFTIEDGTNDLLVKVTDGTVAGTKLVKRISKPAAYSSWSPYATKPAGNGLYFKIGTVDNAGNNICELWFTDGTEANTRLISNNSYLEIGGSHMVTVIKHRDVQPSNIGDLFFFWKATGTTSNTPMTLWKTDGTSAGTSQVSSSIFNLANNLEEFDYGITFNGYYYFRGGNGTTNYNHLYRTDGTAVETIKQFPLTLSGTGIDRMGTVFKNKLFFVATTEVGVNGSSYTQTEVWETDGTEVGTKMFYNFKGNDSGMEKFEVNDRFSFRKTDHLMLLKSLENTSTVYYTDGTSAGTAIAFSGVDAQPARVITGNNSIYFLRMNTSNDTPKRVNALIGFPPVAYSFDKKIFSEEGKVLNNTLWFMNKDTYSSYNVIPWRSTGTDTTTFATANSNFGMGGFGAKTFILNGELYFITNYLGFMNMSLYKFNPDYTFTNAAGDNNWSNVNNWVAKNIPLNNDNVTIPAAFSPNINGAAFANDLTVNSPLNISTGSLNISGNLNLGANITLNNNNLNLKGGSSNVSRTAMASGHYIVTNGTGTVNIENLDAARGTVNLPIGTATNYNPISISNSGTSDTFSARVSDGISNTTNGAVNSTWEISEATAGGSNVNLSLGWNASQENSSFSRNSAKVGHYLNGSWNEENSGTVSGTDPFTISATGITSFSPFSVMNFGALATHNSIKNGVEVYPNPFSELLNISCLENGTVSFYDMSGKLISTEFLVKGTNLLNKSNLQKGIYIYQIKGKDGNVVANGKIIKK